MERQNGDDRPGFLIAFRLSTKQSSDSFLLPPLSPRAAMAELYENLAGLRGLYQDLSAASTSPLCNVERLVFELDTHIQDFRKLLDKPAKNNKSRQDVLSGE